MSPFAFFVLWWTGFAAGVAVANIVHVLIMRGII